jgi:2-(1,2-epoxy-1,2-dihydrophenyl)acetyl-CoA isomerase
MGGTYLLARQVGLGRAQELLLTWRRIGSAEARDLRLVAHVWTDDFEPRSTEYCAELARGATRALGLTKVLADRAMDLSLPSALDQEELEQAVAGSTADHRDALETFRSTGSLDVVQFKGE